MDMVPKVQGAPNRCLVVGLGWRAPWFPGPPPERSAWDGGRRIPNSGQLEGDSNQALFQGLGHGQEGLVVALGCEAGLAPFSWAREWEGRASMCWGLHN